MSRKYTLIGWTLAACLIGTTYAEIENQIHGAGWFEFGRIEKSSTFEKGSFNDLNKNWVQNSGGEINIVSQINPHWKASFGLGAIQVHLPRGGKRSVSNLYVFTVPYVGKTNVEYLSNPDGERSFQLTLGSFHYNYNPDVKNLGLYLMQGYVYPGILTRDVRAFVGGANVTGMKGTYTTPNFRNDLIVKWETEDRPFYDLSVADFLNYKVFEGLELGFGVNMYRVFAMDPNATSPGKDCDQGVDLGTNANVGQDEACFLVDTVKTVTGNPPDTTVARLDTIPVSLSGTKAVFRFRFDPKFGAGEGVLGENDMVFYGEAALIGFKDYPRIYNNKRERMPMMLGFYVPTLNYFTLTVEVENYPSKNSQDILPAQNGSPIPAVWSGENTSRDDWKWSVNASRMVFGNLFLGAQVASDHLRLGGFHDAPTGRETFVSPKDWYWSLKAAYFF